MKKYSDSDTKFVLKCDHCVVEYIILLLLLCLRFQEEKFDNKLKTGLNLSDDTMPFFAPSATSTTGRPGKVPPPVPTKGSSRGGLDSEDRSGHMKTDIVRFLLSFFFKFQFLSVFFPNFRNVIICFRNVIICFRNVIICQEVYFNRKEGNVLFNDAFNTFYLRLYGIRHMVKDHQDSKRGNLQQGFF